MQLNVTSEIGRLKSVLVHLPGREIDVMIPPMMNQLLFDDILYGQVAREEHRRFQQLIRFIAPEVIDIQDLLEEILEDADVKRLILRDLEKRKFFGRKLASTLGEQPAALLAQTLIGGIPHERDGKGELPSFDLLPVPNYFFMRDPQVVIGDGVVVCGMATQARRRESLLSGYVFGHHPLLRGNRRWSDFVFSAAGTGRTPTIEGGDILVPSRDLLLVGVTERTNRAGVRQLATSLRDAGSDVKTIIVVELPRQRSFMHLDTVFTFTSASECLIYPPVILPGGSQAATVTTIDLTKKSISYAPQKSLLRALKKHGFDLDPIYCGGRSAVDQQREQWTDGANAFTLAPGIILLYERNVRTAEELAAHGYHIIYEDDLLLGRTELETWTDTKYAIQMAGHELSRARGGPRCMTMPLVREDL
ncbi:MAG: arginine deiminase [Thermoanaerobaculia bacterium]|jgi:arginine deiminase|nr:arginine deiminase [Thermoanaerobaculia bacterium]